MKYKIGDVVQIRSIKWFYEQDKDSKGNISKGLTFVFTMSHYCGKKYKIYEINENVRAIDGYAYKLEDEDKDSMLSVWESWMFETEYPIIKYLRAFIKKNR